ncbi:MAG: proteasome-type protease [Pseudomonadota bacterium]
MTYCVGMTLNSGLVFMSDTRTNAGVDNISVFKKMFTWQRKGERAITIMTAGNLATTQAVVSLLDERTKAPSERTATILDAPSMFQVATMVGETLRDVIKTHAGTGQKADAAFNASVIVGGQIAGSDPRLFLVYPEGNFVEAGEDTPFFQIGETKYGKPILVRAYDPAMTFEDALKLLMVSFDSTIKANLSVGQPLDFQVYEKDAFELGQWGRIERGDAYFNKISDQWGEELRSAFAALPDFEFDD